MQIHLNGEAREFACPPTIADVLAAAGLAGRRVAVEVNRCIVPRVRHAEHRLAEGDVVEVVHALGGG
jgi:sulfur carrier protein